jgi:hypothetical protein
VVDHEAADHDVVAAVGGVEGFGDPHRVGAVGEGGGLLGLGDCVAGGVDAVGGAVGPDGCGHGTGEVPGAAADVERSVAVPGAAGSGEPAEEAVPTAAEEDSGDEVVTSVAFVSHESTGGDGVGIAVPSVRCSHHNSLLKA